MAQTRKARKKATTDLGRSIMQRERQRLAREQSALAEKLAEDAAAARRMQKKMDVSRPVEDADRAIQRSIVRRVAGVLASEGVNATIEVTPIPAAAPIDAWTDFQRIHVGYHLLDDVRLTAAVLRGLFYHEGGHCRWTVPFTELSELARIAGADIDTINDIGFDSRSLHRAWNALEDQRMETAVVSDSPRKAGYFTPMVLSELAADVNAAKANWPLMVWRRYLPSKVVAGARRLFVVANGPDGEKHARRIENIVDTYVQSTDPVEMLQAVVDMAVMFSVITPLAFNLDQAGHARQYRKMSALDPDALQIPVDPSWITEPQDADEEAEERQEPKSLADLDPSEVYHIMEVLAAALLSPETLIKIQFVMPPSEGDDEGQSGSSSGPQGQSEGEGGSKSEQDDDSDKDSKGDQDDNLDSDDDESKNEDKESKSKSEDVPTRGAGSSGSHESDDEGIEAPTSTPASDETLTEDDLQEALSEAEAERMKDTALDQDVQSFHNSKDDASSKLDIYVGGQSSNTMAIAEAGNLADDMQRSFEAATTEIAPSWHEEQRRGIVNVLRYATRQPGDVEFFRGWVDNGAPGHDIAVSVLLDYSGSMGGAVEQLAKVAFASKAACDRLGVPCTVVLWDTSARVLWDAGETAEHLPIIRTAGGTNPRVALNDLDNQMFGKSKHIVLVMTDDAWDGSAPALNAYKVPGRTIIGLGYTGGGFGSDYIAESMRKKGADAAYHIENLDSIPRLLEQTLIDLA